MWNMKTVINGFQDNDQKPYSLQTDISKGYNKAELCGGVVKRFTRQTSNLRIAGCMGSNPARAKS